ncbi:MAG: 2-C-methyl-D-erythritol 2,4-cyclodiphosphate synthase [Thermaerobacter sp.]|nr:2-C-methyl-D-erythritol 2,4-cyclodiphosphate synthase [Thermaerobacter sp.]
MIMRIGQGVDVHPLVPGRRLVLGGVEVPYSLGLDGDSDGDVLAHAMMDALLGALALGDLGSWFAADDPQVRGGSSVELLTGVAAMVRDRGFMVINVDSTVVAERPRLKPFVPDVRQSLANSLGVPVEVVSVKATTTDHLGAMGREEGIMALAVVLLARQDGPINNG